MRAIAIAVGLLALSACGGPNTVDLAKVATTARELCQRGQPVLAAAAMIPAPQAQIVAAAVSALCVPLLAGQVPATLDANTPAWLGGNLDSLSALLAR